MRIAKTIEWDMGHRIPNHKSECRNLHGHRYRLEITLEGKLIRNKGSSDEGMVMDFLDIKKILLEEIDNECDHAFMLYKGDKKLLEFSQNNPKLKFVIVPFIPTAENIAKWLFNKLDKCFVDVYKSELKLSSVKLWETPSSYAEYSAKDE